MQDPNSNNSSQSTKVTKSLYIQRVKKTLRSLFLRAFIRALIVIF